MLGLSSCKIGNGGEDDSGDAGSDGSQNSGSSSGDSSDALGGNYIWKRGDLLTFALADPTDTIVPGLQRAAFDSSVSMCIASEKFG